MNIPAWAAGAVIALVGSAVAYGASQNKIESIQIAQKEHKKLPGHQMTRDSLSALQERSKNVQRDITDIKRKMERRGEKTDRQLQLIIERLPNKRR